jgi:hypothetical protein
VRPGGKGQQFTDAVLIEMESPQYEENNRWVKLKFYVRKNKTWVAHRRGAFKIWLANEGDHFVGEVDDDEMFLSELLALRLLKTKKKKYVLDFAGDYDEYKTQNAIMEALAIDPVLKYELRKKIIKIRNYQE